MTKDQLLAILDKLRKQELITQDEHYVLSRVVRAYPFYVIDALEDK